MGVVASEKGIEKIKAVVKERKLSKDNYEEMSAGLKLDVKTIKKFLSGTKGVHKNTATVIIEYLGFQRDEIISDIMWDKIEPASLDEIWEELCELAKFAPKRLEIKLAGLPTASCRDRGIPKFTTQIVAGSKIWIDIDVQEPGYLVLLDMDESGEIECLSPSPYIPDPYLNKGLQRTPQAASEDRVYQPATPGIETWIAVILPEKPNFDWLDGTESLVLDRADLSELLEHIKKSKKPINLMRSTVKIV